MFNCEKCQKCQKFFDDFFKKRLSFDYDNKFFTYVKTHANMFALLLLLTASVLFIVFGLGNYPLIDVDETRYAVMARDMVISGNWNDLLLNGEPFLEKPPLYFWLVAASVKLFNNFSPFTARLPIGLTAILMVFATYFLGKKVSGIKFGLYSALILLSSVFYLIFAHIAILDMVLTVTMGLTLYCGFLATISQNKTKTLYWFLFYVFMALGFLAKGILAVAFPVIIMFVYCFVTKQLKQVFKPLNLLPGVVVFFLITMPWHIVMYKHYGFTFIQEYYIKHHFARFIDSAELGRKQPLLFFVPVFLAGFFPWVLTFFYAFFKAVKKYVIKFKAESGNILEKLLNPLAVENDLQRLMLFSLIYFTVMFGVLSISSTKLPTYILPVFPAAAFITAYVWAKAEKDNDFGKAIIISTEIIAGVLIVAAMAATFVFPFLPFIIKMKLLPFRDITLYGLLFISILSLMKLKNFKVNNIFSCYLALMLFIMIIAKSYIFNTVYMFGQNELVKYAYVAEQTGTNLIAFDFPVKSSIMTQYSGKVNFIPDFDLEQVDLVVKNSDVPVLVITKNKHAEDYLSELNSRFVPVINGFKYSLWATKNFTNSKKLLDIDTTHHSYECGNCIVH